MELDPKWPSPVFGLIGREVFKAYKSDQFTSDASYRHFARRTLKTLGSLNPIESHAQLYDSVIMPAAEVSAADAEYGCPPVLAELGLDRLGLCWLDGKAVQDQFGLSHFTMSAYGSYYDRPFLCDPYYGLAIFPFQGRWAYTSFTLDWINRRSAVIGDAIKAYFQNPSRILGDGVEAASFFWEHLLDDQGHAQISSGIPGEVQINSLSQLHDFAASLNAALEVTNGNSAVWFRGQNAEYLSPDRSDAVAKGFLPYANIRDASMVTSLYRKAHLIGGRTADYRKFLIDVMAWESVAETIFGPAWVDVPLYEDLPGQEFGGSLEMSSHLEFKDGDGNVIGGRTRHMTQEKSSWQRGLMLQHYGCPTPFLDVTSSIDIAHWFATHTYQGSNSKSLFEPFEWSGDDRQNWPVIYCFILAPRFQPIVKSTRLNTGDVSLRAKLQECGLLGGGGLLARNYAARYIGLKLRLHPDLARQSRLGISDLFPSAKNDHVYRELKKIRSIGADNQFPLYGIK